MKPDRIVKRELVPGLRHESLILIAFLVGSWLLAACTSGFSGVTATATPATVEASPTATPGPVELELKDLQGNQVRLSDFRGKVALVNFWASWCTPCKEDLPVLEAFYQEHKEEGFVLIGINTGESPEDAAKYIAEQGYTFVAWSDPAGNELIRLKARGLPFSFLIDRDGRRIQAWYGVATEELLEEIAGLISEK